MLNEEERLYLRLRKLDRNVVRAAVKRWAASDYHMRKTVMDSLVKGGWHEVGVEPGVMMLEDGRPVVWVDRRALVLPLEEHQRRVAWALEMAAKGQQRPQRRAQNDTPGEALASVLCPSCQATMAKSPVCPNCAHGRAGFKLLCICTECGHEVYL